MARRRTNFKLCQQLCWLGFLGAPKFYTGLWGLGLIYLAIFACLLFFFVRAAGQVPTKPVDSWYEDFTRRNRLEEQVRADAKEYMKSHWNEDKYTLPRNNQGEEVSGYYEIDDRMKYKFYTINERKNDEGETETVRNYANPNIKPGYVWYNKSPSEEEYVTAEEVKRFLNARSELVDRGARQSPKYEEWNNAVNAYESNKDAYKSSKEAYESSCKVRNFYAFLFFGFIVLSVIIDVNTYTDERDFNEKYNTMI